MSATMVSVTVIDSDGASDFAAPTGTTVAGLCAMLAIDLTLPSVRISYADGRPLDGAAVLGRDLPAGSTIALSSRVLSARQLNEASERYENQWRSPRGRAEYAPWCAARLRSFRCLPRAGCARRPSCSS